MRKLLRTAAVIAALTCTTLPAAAATPSEFYAGLLRRGVAAFDAGRYDEASRHLRLAAFGSLENIEQYQTAHAYLAVAHERMTQPDRARESARRVAHAERIQRRFAALALPQAVRSAFEKIAAAALTPTELAALRGSGPMPPAPQPASTTRTVPQPAATQPQTATTQPQTQPAQTQPAQTQPAQIQPAQTQPAQTQPAQTQPATTEPQPTTTRVVTNPPVTVDRVEVQVQRPATSTPQQPAVTQPRTQTPTPSQTTQQQPRTQTPAPQSQTPRTAPASTTPAPVPAAVSYTAAERATRFAAAERALIGANLPEARRIYRELLASQNLDRPSIIRVAEGFYRARDFAATLAAFQRAGALQRGEEAYRYYIAVALYETGELERARRELASALPYIEITPDVAHYRAKIQNTLQ